MDRKKLFLSALGSVALICSSACFAQDEEGGEASLQKMQTSGAEKEKCYGISKAGRNDCAAADGSHSCAGYAKKDKDGKEWVLLPKGTCERIVGASLEPDI
ncbi:MAG TPA: hypothetical protein DIV86_07595 [Alphaproteobacteria bacterium]|nr:hypothetical protein [Alphaproteobacteria bacterium]